MLSIDWSRFDELKHFTFEFIDSVVAAQQAASRIAENQMVVQLLRLLHALLLNGFYTASEITGIIPALLEVLDGRDDTVSAQESARARYQQKRTSKHDTVLMMESKLW